MSLLKLHEVNKKRIGHISYRKMTFYIDYVIEVVSDYKKT